MHIYFRASLKQWIIDYIWNFVDSIYLKIRGACSLHCMNRNFASSAILFLFTILFFIFWPVVKKLTNMQVIVTSILRNEENLICKILKHIRKCLFCFRGAKLQLQWVNNFMWTPWLLCLFFEIQNLSQMDQNKITIVKNWWVSGEIKEWGDFLSHLSFQKRAAKNQ